VIKRKVVPNEDPSSLVIFVTTEYLLKKSALIKWLMTMSTSLKKLEVALIIIIVLLLSFTQADKRIGFSSLAGGEIDLFTQKEPYDGKGPNMPSDAFRLGELVILYALVTYGEVPVENSMVTFYVEPPQDPSFCLTAETNTSGIATVSFTIPQKCDNESEVFGNWVALANVLINGITLQDVLTFKVDWIVKLVSVRTIDQNLTYRSVFGIGGDIGLEITMQNIAMTAKNVTLAIVIQDELSVPVNSSIISDLEAQPNGKLITLYCKLYLPKWSRVGTATVIVSALTALPSEGGVLYCPAASTTFLIVLYNPLTLAFHDVAAVNAIPSSTSVELGQSLNISAVVRNEGTEVESFNVSAYCDNVLIGTLEVATLSPYSEAILDFTLDTSPFSVGNHTIAVSIPYITNEADRTDNDFVDGVIEIKSALPQIIHNIAILGVTISTDSLYIGELLGINVSVVNKGTETEGFDVRTYYGSSLIGTMEVEDLAPGGQVNLVFVWNTSLTSEGFYQISASAPLSGDIDVSDNTYVDGIVHVKTKTSPVMIHDVAVLNVTSSSTLVHVGETVSIDVLVANEGNYTESFNVTLLSDSNVIGISLVENLEIDTTRKLVFQWNTSLVQEGFYQISASASHVPDEIDLSDNTFIDGVIEVLARPPIHDVAVLSVTSSSTFAYIGETVDINVTVKNYGVYAESFNVTVFCNSTAIEILLIENLEPNAETTLLFHWNTQNFAEGNYTLTGSASVVPGEENIENNSYVDGVVEVVKSPKEWVVPDWFYWLLPLLLLLIIILLIAWLYRRRKKNDEEAFYTGWTAWFYSYDLRSNGKRM
jgi:hypothetical protein